MKNILFIVFCLFIFACQQPTSDNEEANWQQLFNGEDLTGWTPKIRGYEFGENFGNTFRVEDGVIKVAYDEYRDTFANRFGHLFYKNPYSHYKLRVEYRFTGEQVPDGPEWAYKNSGVMFHAQIGSSMTLDQDFPVCLEAQFLGGAAEGERPTGNLCTPSTNVYFDDTLTVHHCVSSSSTTIRGEEWVTFELVALGDSIIHHIVNGDTVMTYTKPEIGGYGLPENYPDSIGTAVTGGYFALQSESHPVEFRKVEILELKD